MRWLEFRRGNGREGDRLQKKASGISQTITPEDMPIDKITQKEDQALVMSPRNINDPEKKVEDTGESKWNSVPFTYNDTSGREMNV